MIEVTRLVKAFGDTRAVDDISFTAQPGEIFGLLGPNGAGKSTTIGCISGLLAPTSGNVALLGHDVVKEGPASRRGLGVVPQDLALFEELSAHENLVYWGSAYGLRGSALKDRVQTVLTDIGLLDRANEPVENFSGGMKRRLNFGCGLVHEPKVLLLDEPTVGVDPQSREHVLDLVHRQLDRGMCVLYTTHYMEEAEELCSRLAIMDHGHIIAAGTLDELRDMVGGRDVLRFTGTFDFDRVSSSLSGLEDIEVLSLDSNSLQLALLDAPHRLSAVISMLGEAGADIRETLLSRASLESLFLKLTGKELRN